MVELVAARQILRKSFHVVKIHVISLLAQTELRKCCLLVAVTVETMLGSFMWKRALLRQMSLTRFHDVK